MKPDSFNNHLKETDWALATENLEVNLGFGTFLNLFNKILDKNVPSIEVG